MLGTTLSSRASPTLLIHKTVVILKYLDEVEFLLDGKVIVIDELFHFGSFGWKNRDKFFLCTW